MNRLLMLLEHPRHDRRGRAGVRRPRAPNNDADSSSRSTMLGSPIRTGRRLSRSPRMPARWPTAGRMPTRSRKTSCRWTRHCRAAAQLLQMPRPQIVVDVAERGLGQGPQRLARHHQHVLAQHLLDPHTLAADLLVRRGVGAERKQRRVLVGRDRFWIGKSGGGVMLGSRVGVAEAATLRRLIGGTTILSILREKVRFWPPHPGAFPPCPRLSLASIFSASRPHA